MKKTYINPTMDIIEIQMQNLIATSAGIGGGTQPGGNAAGRELDDLLDLMDE